MKVEKNKMVSLIYELRESDLNGKVIESLDERRPLTFIYGSGRLLPYFENNIESLSKGDNFSFTLKAENAYGERREEMIVDVPVSVFHKEGRLDEEICRVGNEVPMMDSDGNPLTGIINEISDSFVTMDFNHPMAGVDLFFDGRIVDVREATEYELAGAAHSCSGCGSDSGSGCGGGCS